MKRYTNLASQMVILFPICSIVYLVAMILICIYYDGQLIDLVIGCIVLIVVFFCCGLPLICMKDVCIITYYDEEKICQRNLFKRKQIKYEDIKEIYISGSYIYLTSKVYSLKFDEKEKGFKLQRKVNKILKNEVAIMIASDAVFLKYINLENIQVYILKNSIKITVDKYFK